MLVSKARETPLSSINHGELDCLDGIGRAPLLVRLPNSWRSFLDISNVSVDDLVSRKLRGKFDFGSLQVAVWLPLSHLGRLLVIVRA